MSYLILFSDHVYALCHGPAAEQPIATLSNSDLHRQALVLADDVRIAWYWKATREGSKGGRAHPVVSDKRFGASISSLRDAAW
jgi:hypothetical protein